MPRLTHTVRLLSRPAVALVLVVAQAVSAFGFPVVGLRAGTSACGCVTPCGQDVSNCCCKPVVVVKPDGCSKCGGEAGACCHTKPAPEPKPKGCAKCRDREAVSLADCSTCPIDAPTNAATADSAPVVTWVAGFKARQCRGDGPLGLLAELPSVPAASPAHPLAVPVPVGVIAIADTFSASHFAVPLDPPPRCG